MEETKRTIAVLGSTGSVGEQALDVADKFGLGVSCISPSFGTAPSGKWI